MTDSMEKGQGGYNSKSFQDSRPTGISVNATELPYIESNYDVEQKPGPLPLSESPPPKKSVLRYSVHRFWLFEIFALILSTLGLVAILIVLRYTDGRPVPRWKLSVGRYDKSASVTINSVVSLLSTLVKSTVLIPVVAGLGELKWLWFTGKDRKLTDVLVFDGAANGPLGATMMLWKLRGHVLPCLGAIIIIGSLLMDFAFQQLITYPVHPTAIVDIATIPRVNGYNASVPLYQDEKTPESSMIGAIFNGLYNNDSTFSVTPSCSTGNCTWTEVYSTLGVCSRCYDTTQFINKTCSTYDPVFQVYDNNTGSQVNQTFYRVQYCNYTLPSGQVMDGRTFATPPEGSNLNIWLPTTLLVSNLPASNETYFGNVSGGYYSSTFSMLRGKWEMASEDNIPTTHFNLVGANSTECGLEYCVIKYNGSMSRNNFSEEIIDVWTEQNTNLSVSAGQTEALTSDGINLFQGAILTPPSAWTNKTDTSDNNLFVLEYQAGRALSRFFDWTGWYIESTDGYFQEGKNEIINRIHSLDDAGLKQTFANIAVSMTRRMRLSGAPGADNARPDVRALGQTFQDTTYVRVRWGWIGLPGAIVFLSAVFLAGTFIQAKRAGADMLWKSSGLASFYHPLPSEAAERLSEAHNAQHAEKIANELRVKWEKTASGGQFKLA